MMSRKSRALPPRVGTHWSQPEDDSGCEGNSREEDRWASVVAGGDATPVFQAAERDLDAAATPVAALVVSDRFVARSPTWDAGLNAFGFQGIPTRNDAPPRWRSGKSLQARPLPSKTGMYRVESDSR